MKTLLLCDTETSGLDAGKDHLLEVGLVRWSLEHRCVFACASWLVTAPENAAVAVNGIPVEAVRAASTARETSDERFRQWAQSADAILAHGDFDRKWLPDVGKPWIDTCNDIEWPRASESRSLVALCLAHGVGVSHAHRALTDCLLLARLLERVAELGHDVEKLLSDALLPRITLQALQRFEDNDKAKAAGFRFDGSTKRWLKRVRKDQPGEYPFRIREVSAKGDEP